MYHKLQKNNTSSLSLYLKREKRTSLRSVRLITATVLCLSSNSFNVQMLGETPCGLSLSDLVKFKSKVMLAKLLCATEENLYKILLVKTDIEIHSHSKIIADFKLHVRYSKVVRKGSQ